MRLELPLLVDLENSVEKLKLKYKYYFNNTQYLQWNGRGGQSILFHYLSKQH